MTDWNKYLEKYSFGMDDGSMDLLPIMELRVVCGLISPLIETLERISRKTTKYRIHFNSEEQEYPTAEAAMAGDALTKLKRKMDNR